MSDNAGLLIPDLLQLSELAKAKGFDHIKHHIPVFTSMDVDIAEIMICQGCEVIKCWLRNVHDIQVSIIPVRRLDGTCKYYYSIGYNDIQDIDDNDYTYPEAFIAGIKRCLELIK